MAKNKNEKIKMLLVGLAFLLILVAGSFSNDGLRLTQRPLPP